jgi:hypothetical protein
MWWPKKPALPQQVALPIQDEQIADLKRQLADRDKRYSILEHQQQQTLLRADDLAARCATAVQEAQTLATHNLVVVERNKAIRGETEALNKHLAIKDETIEELHDNSTRTEQILLAFIARCLACMPDLTADPRSVKGRKARDERGALMEEAKLAGYSFVGNASDVSYEPEEVLENDQGSLPQEETPTL